MVSEHSKSVTKRAKELYEERLRSELEQTHRNEYVAIEPESGEFFLGATFSAAALSARQSHPDRISFVLRVGHEAAIHLGGSQIERSC